MNTALSLKAARPRQTCSSCREPEIRAGSCG